MQIPNGTLTEVALGLRPANNKRTPRAPRLLFKLPKVRAAVASTCVTCLWVQTHTECVYVRACVCVCVCMCVCVRAPVESTCVTCLWVQTHTECVYMCVCVCWICCHPLVEVGRCGSALDVGLCAILPKFHPLLVPNNDVYHLIYIIDRSQGPRRLISAILARAIFEKHYGAIQRY